MLFCASHFQVAIFGVSGVIQVANVKLAFEINAENNLIICYYDKDNAVQKAFLARYAQLKVAAKNSLSALQNSEKEEDVTVADIGMLYLEQLKLHKEVTAMEAVSSLETNLFKVVLTPSAWEIIPQVGMVCWIPKGYDPQKSSKTDLIHVNVAVTFDNNNETFQFKSPEIQEKA
jgi:hypothetical protein